jgi:NADPH-dependent 2,4-dienoyl-CoA reductase/sulfur reductase-like enzyme
VDAALSGPTAATTTDVLKRRCGVGFGDCQGNRCLATAIERLAVARRAPPTEIVKHLDGSWLVGAIGDAVPPGIEGATRTDIVPLPRGDEGRAAVVVVGGGLAGVGAAIALADSGVDVLVVDRGARPGGALAAIGPSWWAHGERSAVERLGELARLGQVRWRAEATVVGLGDAAEGWTVDIASATGSQTVDAGAVILATGSYLTPREHRSIDGPRPSGIMTADFAADALDRGWRPGSRTVVVGDGRIAHATAERLTRAGLDVVTAPDGGGPAGEGGRARPVGAVRGERRLEAVEVDGRWIEVDTLVFADALRPASFLLRGLGIGDDRPGVAMPADGSGALPLRDLWAAGTCVEPRLDHDGSLAAGTAVGHNVAAALATAAGPGAR